ncbi:MAG: adenylate/guanylate cyclase domain-containing protein [Paracoccaceae bacterium]
MNGTRDRRLAAIMVLDVVGYTAMMAQDEDNTLSRVLEEQRDLIQPAIEAEGGRVVKRMGDGMLAEFASVTAALSCALTIQNAAQDLTFRIGINLGEVIDEDGDIFGDGVNVASRIEALARPGGIALSHEAKVQAHRVAGLTFEDMGRFQVKNVPVPVHVYHVSASSNAPHPVWARLRPLILRRWMTGLAAILVVIAFVLLRPSIRVAEDPLDLFDFDRPSVVVLPFEAVNVSKENLVLGDGLTTNLITDLARIGSLIVVSPPKTDRKSWAENEASYVGVASHVVTGTIQTSGNRVRVSAMLTDTQSNRQLWANRFDREIGEYFSLQDEITTEIVKSLEVTLSSVEQNQLSTRSAAKERREYELVFAALNRNQSRSTTGATSAFWQTMAGVETDELIGRIRQNGYVNAPGLSDLVELDDLDEQALLQSLSLTLLNDPYLFSGPMSDTAGRVSRLGTLAVSSIDKKNRPAELLTAMALDKLFAQDHQAALELARDAVRAIPSYADGYTTLAWVLIASGNTDAAERALTIAKRLSPAQSAWHLTVRAEVHLAAGRTQQSLKAATAALKQDPGFTRARLMRIAAYGLNDNQNSAEIEMSELTPADRKAVKNDLSSILPYADHTLLAPFVGGLKSLSNNG